MNKMYSNKKIARLAGLAYLILIITGLFTEVFVRSELIVWDDPAATVNNIQASEWLFRLGFVSDLICVTSWLLLGLALYVLLKPVNKTHSLLMIIFVLAGASIMGINMLNHFAPLVILDGTNYLGAFNTEQLNGLVMLFLDLHSTGYVLNAIFFGLWLLPLGYLVFKSAYFPRIIGILLIMGGSAILIDFFRNFLFPDYEGIIGSITGITAAVAEFFFCLWLLIMGAKEQKAVTLAASK